MLKLTLLSPLRHRPYRLLLAGQVISDLGDWLDYLALVSTLVYRWQLGAPALAALAIAMALPWVFVSPLAGVWVDRWPRRFVMVVTDVARAAAVLGLIWAPNLEAVLAFVTLKGVFSVFFGPAKQSAIQQVVPDEDLLTANSLGRLSNDLAKIVGPTIGGLVTASWGPRGAFMLDALSFLVSAALLSRLQLIKPPGRDQTHKRPGFWSEFRAGAVYVLHHRPLVIGIGSMALAFFALNLYDSIGVLGWKELGFDQSLTAVSLSTVGLGTVMGAAFVGQWGKNLGPFRIMAGGQTVHGLLVAIMGVAICVNITGHGAIWLSVLFMAGFSIAAVLVPYGYVLQNESPPALMGRVSALSSSLLTTFQLLGPLVGSALAHWLGVGFLFVLAGSAMLVVGVGLLLVSNVVTNYSRIKMTQGGEQSLGDQIG